MWHDDKPDLKVLHDMLTRAPRIGLCIDWSAAEAASLRQFVRELPSATLVELLRSPDPDVRDEVGFSELARRISSGAEDENLVNLGEQMTAMFSDPEIQARTFAALVLAEVVDRDRITGGTGEPAVLRWRDLFAAWFRAEQDLRGWDDRLGWVHAVAHGADALGSFGRSPRLGADDLAGLLLLARDRLLAPTTLLFANMEDERLANAIALVLSRPELDAESATTWLGKLGERLAAGEPGPVPAWGSNAMRTLRMLYVLADRGIRLPDTEADGGITVIPHGVIICGAVADVLRLTWPYLG